MAQPIYSYVSEKSNRRYFLTWDTISGYPKTLPMNLLQFIQYHGTNNRDFLEAFFQSYPQLLATGSTLKDNSFADIPQVFLSQILAVTDVAERDVDIDVMENSLNKLEAIFGQFDFSKLYHEIDIFFNHINKYLPRPKHYYLSWDYTMRLSIDKDSAQMKNAILHLKANGLAIFEENEKDHLDSWFKANAFHDYRDLMSDIFLKWAKFNYIELTAIPHLLRNGEGIRTLYKEYGMEHFLPSEKITYSLTEQSNFKLRSLESTESNWKQFFNFSKFCDFGVADCYVCHIFTGKSLDELESIAYHNNLFIGFLNFLDQWGNRRHPLIFTELFQPNPDDNLIALSRYGIQSLCVALKDGEIIDSGNYYDIDFHDAKTQELLPPYCYVATCSDGYTQVSGKYNVQTGKLIIDKLQPIDFFADNDVTDDILQTPIDPGCNENKYPKENGAAGDLSDEELPF